MKMRMLIAGLALAVICGIIGLAMLKRQAGRATAVELVQAPRQAEPARPAAPVEVAPVVEESPVPVEPAPAKENVPSPEPVRTKKKAQPAVTQNNQGKGKGDPPPTDILAREMLSFVGMDLDATAYWVGAINDPDLPAEERKNLIEDLNEDGLPDPKYPTMEDLPLITSRIRLIEQLVADAMDQDNLDAFAEAYKDLMNLADLARGGGEPVK